MMYDELIKRLRWCASYDPRIVIQDCNDAADAIEELQKQLREEKVDNVNLTGWLAEEHAKAEDFENKLNLWRHDKISRWIPIESRPMDEEERQYYSEHFGYDLTDDDAIIYCCQLPEDGEEVLVCDKWDHVWIDTFDSDPDYGVGFETNGDMDGIVAWMPKPKPYKPPKEET